MSATKLTRREQRAQAQHFIDTLEGSAFPNSKRIYITGTHPGVRVPMREIQLSPTLIGGSKEQPQYEENEAIFYEFSSEKTKRCDILSCQWSKSD